MGKRKKFLLIMATCFVAIAVFVIYKHIACTNVKSNHLMQELDGYNLCFSKYSRSDFREYSGYFNSYNNNALCIFNGRNIPYGYSVDSIYFKNTIK